ncbi:6-pyruvoyl tetrahydropterin synthase family protein [Microtetraspora fusca]|uniref:6-carboxy-5,6,7,8-tetrahydropterin synthase n=1 Tax=Microtetraspora fusca TaxID=1997 RepID=A0ABW6VI74_MICFU
MTSVTCRHNFETAHRLPHLGGKCQSLHGHSWWAEVTILAPGLSEDYTVAEFGLFKAAMRGWIDAHLDHGAMLGHRDPLVSALRSAHSKVFVFGEDWPGAAWPTVEAVAHLIATQAATWIHGIPGLAAGAHISRVRISETHVNAAEWAAQDEPTGLPPQAQDELRHLLQEGAPPA